MRKLVTATLIATLGLGAVATPALADPYDGHRNDRGREWRHDGRGDYRQREWHRGDRFDRGEWRRYRAIDYRAYHLRRPPYGYEWREVNGRFILAAVASGIVADIILHQR